MNSVNKLVNSTKSLGDLSKCQNDFMKIIYGNKISLFLLTQFAEDKYLDRDTFNKFFKLASDYKSAKTIGEPIQLFEKIRRVMLTLGKDF